MATQQGIVSRLRAVDAALVAATPRLEFIAAVNVEAAADALAYQGAPVAAAQRRAVASVATVLARRLRVLCAEGGDTSDMAPLAEVARQELANHLAALGCDVTASDDDAAALPQLPAPSSDDLPGTVLTPHAAAARAQQAAMPCAMQQPGADAAAEPGLPPGPEPMAVAEDHDDDRTTAGGAAPAR